MKIKGVKILHILYHIDNVQSVNVCWMVNNLYSPWRKTCSETENLVKILARKIARHGISILVNSREYILLWS